MSLKVLTSLSIIALLGWSTAPSAWAQPARFETPEAALEQFRQALVNRDGDALADLWGEQYREDLIGGDPAAARRDLEEGSELALEGLALLPGNGGEVMTVLMGDAAWPMPIPLVRAEDGWFFDTAAGIEEIIDRRIGENELAVIETIGVYLDAQLAYASSDLDGDLVLEYAQKFLSTPGLQDGLYWAPEDGLDVSPLQPLASKEQDYLKYYESGDPYFGYNFKVLTKQGPNPPGGAYDYVINGNMIAGFAVVAWPADYGNSGIMTFVANHRGEIFEKDLGDDTPGLAASMTTYNPDQTWQPVVVD